MRILNVGGNIPISASSGANGWPQGYTILESTRLMNDDRQIFSMDKDTKICISIAERPGTFGLTFHNHAYQVRGLNYVYIPLKVSAGQLESTIRLVRDNFHACSASMPHKVDVMPYLDEFDESAAKTGAVNTILNSDGMLKGYNTDYDGAKSAIQKGCDTLVGKQVLMIGAGGVARAVGNAVKDLQGSLAIVNRTEEKAEQLAKKLEAEYLPWNQVDSYRGHLIINATSVGMGTEEMVVPEEVLSNFTAVMDVVIGQTEMLKVAERLGKETIPGVLITAYQAARQFEIYTGEHLPDAFIRKTMGL